MSNDKTFGFAGDPGLSRELSQSYEKLKAEYDAHPTLIKTLGAVALTAIAIPLAAKGLRFLSVGEPAVGSALSHIEPALPDASAQAENLLSHTVPGQRAVFGQIKTAAAAESNVVSEIPDIWQPKRLFASRDELIREAGFPGIERVPFAKPRTLDNLVAHVRTPMSSWIEDLRRAGKERQECENLTSALSGVRQKLAPDPQLEQILNRRVVSLDSSLARFASQSALPEVPVVRGDPGDFTAAVDRLNGTMKLSDNYVLSASGEDAHRFVGTIAHEETHRQQIALMIRSAAQRRNISYASGVPGFRALNQVVGADIDYIGRILKADPAPLTAVEDERVGELWQGINIGMEGDGPASRRFMSVRNDLLGLHGKSNFVFRRPSEFAGQILTQASDPEYAQLYFGSEKLPEPIDRLHQLIVKEGKTEFLPEAVEKLKPVLSDRLHHLNDEVRLAYGQYMQLHEKEALLVGELARLRSLELGAVSDSLNV